MLQSIKNWFKRGGQALTGGETLKTINDHPKINIDPEELARIERNFDEYKGNYPQVEYINSMGHLKKRNYMHLNMLKLSSELLSGLVFNEQCEIVVSDAKEEDETTNTYKSANDFIQHVFEHNDFKKNLARYLDPMFATGGLAVRPYVDQQTGEIEFSWALANAFYPLRNNSNGISEGVMKFTTMKIENGKKVYYTLLEFHEWQKERYLITNELYKSNNKGEVGKQVNLSELYEELEEEVYIERLSRPNFNYLKPSGFNNINPHSPLGLGITDNCKNTLKQINDTFDQFNWEIKMGQRTVFVSDQMLSVLPAENGMPPQQIFDPDTNVFKSMRMASEQEFVKDVTNDIRTEQYIAAINQSLKTLEMELKLSVGTFSFDGRSMKTATEVVSENDLTYRTRNDHVNEVGKFIKGLVVSVLELAKAYKLFNGDIPTFEHIGVDFDDGVFQDRSALLRFYGQAKTFGFIPSAEAIQRIFKVPKETAEQWVKEVQKEQTDMDPTNISDRAAKHLFGEEE
ncbi:phage portal protein [Salipaludibacillus sp. LMS25]|uniref:phage portal protein n=1 Tax=Salipaludibacillus TaxID=1884449 RepID=UPI0020CFEC93|nr:phage portal protein [Salipaludibacillus sp. LMS25]UTR17021.1 phage portal protein [Salipaludibacillus sp. LMS25]